MEKGDGDKKKVRQSFFTSTAELQAPSWDACSENDEISTDHLLFINDSQITALGLCEIGVFSCLSCQLWAENVTSRVALWSIRSHALVDPQLLRVRNCVSFIYL